MIGFFAIAIVLISSAVWTIGARKPVYSVVALLLHFTALAAMYLTLSAEFMAVIQIIVYSGAILVLFLFVIALLSSGVAPFSLGPNRLPHLPVPAFFATFVGLGMLIFGVANANIAQPTSSVSGSTLGATGTAGVFGSVADFGRALFTTQLLPFEVTAFVLMVAVIGVVMLAGGTAPYVPTRRRAAAVEREMREAIQRGGEES